MAIKALTEEDIYEKGNSIPSPFVFNEHVAVDLSSMNIVSAAAANFSTLIP